MVLHEILYNMTAIYLYRTGKFFYQIQCIKINPCAGVQLLFFMCSVCLTRRSFKLITKKRSCKAIYNVNTICGTCLRNVYRFVVCNFYPLIYNLSVR